MKQQILAVDMCNVWRVMHDVWHICTNAAGCRGGFVPYLHKGLQ